MATDPTSWSTAACRLQIRRLLSNFPRSSSESTQIETRQKAAIWKMIAAGDCR
ncbi:hypothetical protein GHK28_09125 [Sinorhizobium medicae]|nr:hypothetical protein [Sinorhizobium medicae]MQV45040.1 hypothetical protein [Sinorhizobium medicae]MQV51608.1 hypothetical protein [Sinorhizobium medicae]MQV72111.1 hypothetical protein [Sinorhizobium medicae]